MSKARAKVSYAGDLSPFKEAPHWSRNLHARCQSDSDDCHGYHRCDPRLDSAAQVTGPTPPGPAATRVPPAWQAGGGGRCLGGPARRRAQAAVDHWHHCHHAVPVAAASGPPAPAARAFSVRVAEKSACRPWFRVGPGPAGGSDPSRRQWPPSPVPAHRRRLPGPSPSVSPAPGPPRPLCNSLISIGRCGSAAAAAAAVTSHRDRRRVRASGAVPCTVKVASSDPGPVTVTVTRTRDSASGWPQRRAGLRVTGSRPD